MRTTFNLQRLRVLQRRRNKEDNTPPLITCRDVLNSSRSLRRMAIEETIVTEAAGELTLKDFHRPVRAYNICAVRTVTA